MSNMKAIVAAAAITPFAAVDGAIITQTLSGSNLLANISGQPDAPVHHFSLNKFDSSLGTLNSVTTRVSYRFTSAMGAENLTNQAVTSSFSVGGVSNEVYNGNFLNGFFIGPAIEVSRNFAAFDGVWDNQGPSGAGGPHDYSASMTSVINHDGLTVYSDYPSYFYAMDGFMDGNFVGMGALDVGIVLTKDVYANNTLITLTNPNGETFSFDYQIDYDYTPVPAPSAALPVAALAAAMANRRRR